MEIVLQEGKEAKEGKAAKEALEGLWNSNANLKAPNQNLDNWQ